MKHFKDPSRNRISFLLTCSTVPQATALPFTPKELIGPEIILWVEVNSMSIAQFCITVSYYYAFVHKIIKRKLPVTPSTHLGN
jgi:hypothetical protein